MAEKREGGGLQEVSSQETEMLRLLRFLFFSSPWTPGASDIRGGSSALRKTSGYTLLDVFPG